MGSASPPPPSAAALPPASPTRTLSVRIGIVLTAGVLVLVLWRLSPLGQASRGRPAVVVAGEAALSGAPDAPALPTLRPPLSAAAAPETAVVVLSTKLGDIRLRLRPDWHAGSVAYVRDVADHGLCTQCEFYRVEPGFLVQGILRASIPANNGTRAGPRLMVRGDVGWAGGLAGPDFFIYLGPKPAAHWGLTHTVWAEVADNASLAVADVCAAQQPKARLKPGAMRMAAERIAITMGKYA